MTHTNLDKIAYVYVIYVVRNCIVICQTKLAKFLRLSLLCSGYPLSTQSLVFITQHNIYYIYNTENYLFSKTIKVYKAKNIVFFLFQRKKDNIIFPCNNEWSFTFCYFTFCYLYIRVVWVVTVACIPTDVTSV
jgi:hypothetical protein